MRFWKYHGLGNDFAVVDGISEEIPVDIKMCQAMCDRHFGIGADGVLYIMPGQDGSDITMRVINPDGSEAEMCGNGIRCVAKHAYDFGLVRKKEFSIHTGRGNLMADVTVSDGAVASVKINMGAPILDCARIPVSHDGTMIDEPVTVDGVKLRGSAVSMGNPHFVTFDGLDEGTIDRLGPLLERDRMFPRKANIEFASVKDGKIYIRVFERGAGWTLACGTGACATATAAALNGLVPYGRPVDVHLPGGWLKITVDKDLGYVLMDGPATYVYSGDYIPAKNKG
jgi:diaminopimelate epimerase